MLGTAGRDEDKAAETAYKRMRNIFMFYDPRGRLKAVIETHSGRAETPLEVACKGDGEQIIYWFLSLGVLAEEAKADGLKQLAGAFASKKEAARGAVKDFLLSHWSDKIAKIMRENAREFNFMAQMVGSDKYR